MAKRSEILTSKDIYINKNTYSPFIFSREGVVDSADIMTRALVNHYNALRRDMFRWSDSSGLCDEMFIKSHYRCPEEHLVEFGEISFFELNGNVHALPISEQFREINIYGYLDEWRVVGVNPLINQMLAKMPLTSENAVICEDSLTHTNDTEFIRNIVYGMVDILLTMRQRSLLNRQPIIISDPGENLKQGEVGEFVNSLMSCKPYIIRNKDLLDFKVFDTNISVDIGITDYFNFLETLILTHIGYDATDVHKRAQQSVPETMLAQDKIMARRLEKLRLREEAAERCNKLFGTDLQVTSVLDSYNQNSNVSAVDTLGDEINSFINSDNNE